MKPIFFTSEMVRAILEGRKTETRRLVKFKTSLSFWNPKEVLPHPGGGWFAHDGVPGTRKPLQSKGFMCPYGNLGDKLWVRETWTEVSRIQCNPNLPPVCLYRASQREPWRYKWKPSIYMPKKYSRITLEITSLHIEPLRDITEEKAKREGAPLGDHREANKGHPKNKDKHPHLWHPSYREGFRILWDSIYKKKGFGWDTNPWVHVVGFRMEEK